MPRGNPQNLDPCRTKEEATKRGRNGGIKSGKARRNKAMLRDCLEILMEKKYLDEKTGKKLTGAEMLSIDLFTKALEEVDVSKKAKAFEVIRDTAGQKPIDKIMVSDIDPNVINEVEEIVMNDEQ